MIEPQIKFQVDFVYSNVINFAMQQNHVPAGRKLSIKNCSEIEVKDIIVEISAEPDFAISWNQRIDALQKDEIFEVSPIDLKIFTKYLAELTEKVSGTFTLTISVSNSVVFKETYRVNILAYDQWNGITILPEMLASFVTPNHPQIPNIIIRASDILEKWTGNPSFDEYQTRNPDRVRKQMASIYESIAEMQLIYCSVPASFEETGQRIRMCDTIFANKMANCLDISLLFASCLEAVGIHPLIIIIKGHAFVGAWLINESFADSVNDDISLITKRTADGINEIAVVEATCMNAGQKVSFDEGVRSANYKLVNEDEFLLFIDIRRSRFSGIRPMPLRVQTLNGWEIVENEKQNRINEVPEEIVASNKLIDVSHIDVSKQRMWERKLLDLTLRNNLLNLRVTKNTIQFISANLCDLEDALADGVEFQILSKPTDWDNTLRNVGVYQALNQSDPITDLVKQEFLQKRLRSYLSETELAVSLTNLFRASKLSLEENGANTLYVAFGLLKWFETSVSELPRYAPIVLLPVEIIRKSAQRGYIIRTREEEAMMNITLLEKLRQDFGINISGLENLPKDGSGVDLKTVLSIMRKGIMSNARWDVEEQAFLGAFSFNKFIMWNDIHLNSDKLSQNKIVASLISGKIEWETEAELKNIENLDDTYHPSALSLPISADSSQLEAIRESAMGKSFVLHGPPGTGKSQTITNIIANALYNGKKVLFVAEKMAALEVVQDRLNKIGIGEFCLELHSKKSKKSNILERLKKTTEITKKNAPENFQAEAERIHILRNELNGYVNALHKKYPFGFSLYDSFTGDAQLIETPDKVRFSEQALESLTKDQVTFWNDLVEELQAAGSLCTHPHNHPLEAIKIYQYSQQLKNNTRELISKFIEFLKSCRAKSNTVCSKLRITTQLNNKDQFEALNIITKLILNLPDTPAAMIGSENIEQVLSQVITITEHGEKRDALRDELFQVFHKTILSFESEQALTNWTIANNKWFIPRFFQQNAIKKSIKKISIAGKIGKNEIVNFFQKINSYHEEQGIIDENEKFLSPILGFMWQNGDCDWGKIVFICNSLREINRQSIYVINNALKVKEWRINLSQELAEGSNAFLSLNGKDLKEFLNDYNELNKNEKELQENLGIDFSGLKYLTGNWLNDTENIATLWLENIEYLRDWFSWLNTKEKATTAGLQPIVSAYEKGEISSNEVVNAFKKGLYRSCADYIINNDVQLSSFNGKLFEEKIRKFKQMSQNFEILTKEELFAKLASKIPSFTQEASQSSEIGILQRTIRNNGRAMPIRKLFDSIPNLLPRIAPCMLMSPISVAQYFDTSAAKFDLVVFDEASQMPTCEAVGAIARGSNLIIVGDPKQMPPTSFFSSNYIDEENIEKEDLESILDDCLALSMPSKHLLWHYRSKHESLIAFSNSKFYENKLLTFPSPDDLTTRVHYVPVEGYYDRGKTRQNEFEAKVVIDEIVQRLSDPVLSKRSIGVVTFSSAQQILIQNMLDEIFTTNPNLEAVALNTTEPIFIKNLENVQGDERDVILFSVGYGPDKEGKVSLNFGPLNREGGWRRLNVAVSRARYEMKVFSTIRADQIDITRTASEGVAGLKAFLEYADKGRSTLSIRNVLKETKITGLEKLLSEEIKKFGYNVQTNIGYSGYRIDIGVVDPAKPSEYILGILCDGATYYSAKTARDREIVQRDVLKLLGWNIHNVWSTDWWENAGRVISDIVEAIKNAELSKNNLPTKETENILQIVENKEAMVFNNNQSNIQQETKSHSSGLSTEYNVCNLEIIPTSSSDDFLQYYNFEKIRNQLVRIVEEEAPISRDLLCRRVLSAWGISKMGSRISTQFDQLLKQFHLKQTGSGKNIFYWNVSQNPDKYEVYRISKHDSQKRDAIDLPPEEVANGVKEILINQISLPKDELVRETARLFGFARLGGNVEMSILRGIDSAIHKGYAIENNERIVIKE